MKNLAGVMKFAVASGLSGIMISTPSWAQPSGDIEEELLRIQEEWATAMGAGSSSPTNRRQYQNDIAPDEQLMLRSGSSGH